MSVSVLLSQMEESKQHRKKALMEKAGMLTKEVLDKCKKYSQNAMAHTLACTLSKTNLTDAAYDANAGRKLTMNFSIDLCSSTVTNQKASGRCWIFAALNVMREAAAKNSKMESLELSQNYIAFWDKFEKINYFLEAVICSADLPVGDRTLDWLLQGLNDGGQWDMITDLVKKYGVVPKSAMPETYQSSNTKDMNQMLNTKLRGYAIELRRMIQEGQSIAERKEAMLCEMYQALCICFGNPPEEFTFDYRDAEKNYHSVNCTPQSFYEQYVKLDLSDYVSIINAPTADKPYGHCYTIKYLGNLVEGCVRYLNVSMEDLKELVIKQMKAGELVWFGSDCSKYSDKTTGIWDIDSFAYGEVLGGLTFDMTKEERLDYRDSAMNHAMVLVGVNLDENGQPNRWKIENSWGEEAGQKGYFIASDAWFNEFTYQVVINKKYLSEDQLKAYNEEPKVLEPWDPMGSLA